jgi:hypothetical protein
MAPFPDLILTHRKRISSDQGATLVEMLVALAISVLIFGVLSTALVQFMLATRWGNHQLRVTNDIQVASLWLGRDALEASSFIPGSGTEYGTLKWADDSQQFRYSYNPTEGALVREYYQDSTLQSTLTVSRHIAAQSDVVFNVSGHLLTVSLTATSGEESQTVTLELAMRSH